MANDQIIEGELLVIDTRIAYVGEDASEYAPFDKVASAYTEASNIRVSPLLTESDFSANLIASA